MDLDPGMRGVSGRRHNLPQPLSSFVGREHARAEVLRLLGTARLVTLTGPGGSGKTRLALEVARALLDLYAAGVWLVEFAPLVQSSLVPGTVASVLQAPEAAGQSAIEALANYVGSKRLLLVLDNCEHLIEACAGLVQTLLAACPHLTILATSRERLRVPDEIAWLVPLLDLPDLEHLPSLDEMACCEAVRFNVRS